MLSSLGRREWLLPNGLGTGLQNTHVLSALKWGTERKRPGVSRNLWLTPREAVSGCSSAVTFLPPWKQGKNYSPYKVFETTANDESMPLETKPQRTRLSLNRSLILQTTQSVTQTHVSSPSPPLGLQDSSAGSSRQSHLLPCISWCLQRKKGQDVRPAKFCWGFAFGKYAVGFSQASSFSTCHLNSLLPASTRLLIADISLNTHSAASSGNLKLPTKTLNLQAAENKRESQNHWPNYAEVV